MSDQDATRTRISPAAHTIDERELNSSSPMSPPYRPKYPKVGDAEDVFSVQPSLNQILRASFPRLPISPISKDTSADAKFIANMMGPLKYGRRARIHAPAKKIHRDDRSSDQEIFVTGTDSTWSMHHDTSEHSSSDAQDDLPDIDLDSWIFQRGRAHHLSIPVDGMGDVPSIIHLNIKNGKSYQSAVDACLFFYRRIIDGVDKAKDLWEKVDSFIGNLFDRCVDKSPNTKEDYPILHRHGRHIMITSHPQTGKEGVSLRIRDTVENEWNELTRLRGSLNDIQNEQRSLVTIGYYILNRYQHAIVSRDLSEMMELSALLEPLANALDELSATQYVIREMHHCSWPAPFVIATED